MLSWAKNCPLYLPSSVPKITPLACDKILRDRGGEKKINSTI